MCVGLAQALRMRQIDKSVMPRGERHETVFRHTIYYTISSTQSRSMVIVIFRIVFPTAVSQP